MPKKPNNSPVPNSRTARKEMIAAHQEVSVTTEFHGPIPDPLTMERYNQIMPGAAERILKMAEDQARHRQDLEKIIIKSQCRDSLLGIIAGFILALVTICAGTYVITKGNIWSGTLLGSAGLVGLVSVFIYGTNSNKKGRQTKDKE